jgi:hypothetical protein
MHTTIRVKHHPYRAAALLLVVNSLFVSMLVWLALMLLPAIGNTPSVICIVALLAVLFSIPHAWVTTLSIRLSIVPHSKRQKPPTLPSHLKEERGTPLAMSPVLLRAFERRRHARNIFLLYLAYAGVALLLNTLPIGSTSAILFPGPPAIVYWTLRELPPFFSDSPSEHLLWNLKHLPNNDWESDRQF